MRRILLLLGPACILVGGMMIYAMRSELTAPSDHITITNGIPTNTFLIAGGRDNDGNAHGLLVDDRGRVIVSPIDSDAQSGGTCPDGREIVLARAGYRCAETSKLDMPR